MSIKSINDLCSDIVEKSYDYSARSLSNESLCLDDDEALADELLHKMDAPVLSKLRRCFKRRKSSEADNDAILDIDRRVDDVMRKAAEEEGIQFPAATQQSGHKTLWADEELFVSSLEKIFGSHKYTTHAQKLFRLLDPFRTRRIWWGHLLDRLLQHGAKRYRNLDDWKPIDDDGTMLELAHCKKETIIKIVSIATTTSFCYIIITKGGKVGAYDGHLKLLSEYDIFFARSGKQRRMKTTWLTDAVYMGDTKTLVIAASDRSLTIYDVSTLAHLPLYLITGVPNIPTCLAYEPSLDKYGMSRLYMGDDHGCITLLQFQQPRICLLHKKFTDRMNDYFWIEVQSPPHDNYCSIVVWKKVHIRSVRRIFYCGRHDVVISCSNDPEASVVIRNRPGKIGDYVFKVLRGVCCFHMSSSLRVLATGSADGCLRLWDPVLTIKPFAKMENKNRKPIVDIVVLAHMELVITFSKNAHIDIWDIYEEVCVQTVRVRYPFIGVLGKRVEFGAYSLYPGPKRRSVVVGEEGITVRGTGSRRGSAVLLETGALCLLNPEETPVEHYRLETRAESDPEHSYWDKLELLVTCCNHVASFHFKPRPSHRVTVSCGSRVPSPLPPPERTTDVRRPSVWDDSERGAVRNTSPSPPQSRVQSRLDLEVTKVTHFLSPDVTPKGTSTAADPGLDTILEEAGLTGILEKNFTLMMGLKQDLNKKLSEMRSKQEAMKGPVSQCAPYIALDLHPLQEIGFSRPLHISERMKKRSGLQVFDEPDNLLTYNTCFNMSSPRSSYSGGSSMPSTARSICDSTPHTEGLAYLHEDCTLHSNTCLAFYMQCLLKLKDSVYELKSRFKTSF